MKTATDIETAAPPSSREDGGSPTTNRRLHDRLAIRLPVECRRDDNGRTSIIRTITQNVSTGGMYIELDASEFQPGDRIRVELIVPPAEGVSPYQGQAICKAEVLRVEPAPNSRPTEPKRTGIAARFLDRLRLRY